MPQLAERVGVIQRRPVAAARRPQPAEQRPSRSMAQAQARVAAPVAARVASPVSQVVATRRHEGDFAGNAGLPPRLRAGVEALSGLAMDDVRVHRNSSEPAKIGALGTALGEAQVNIATFNLGRRAAGGEAVALVSVDDPITPQLAKELCGLPGVREVVPLSF